MYKNQEGYPDPTAGAAYSAIRQEERKREADRLAAISALIPIRTRPRARSTSRKEASEIESLFSVGQRSLRKL